ASLAVMVRPLDDADELADFLRDPRPNAVVLGHGGGGGVRMREMVLAALAGERAVVLDADALTSFAENPQALIDPLRARRAATRLTPHEGEFRRLFSSLVDESQPKLERTRVAAEKAGAVVLLKGPDTVRAAPPRRGARAANGTT